MGVCVCSLLLAGPRRQLSLFFVWSATITTSKRKLSTQKVYRFESTHFGMDPLENFCDISMNTNRLGKLWKDFNWDYVGNVFDVKFSFVYLTRFWISLGYTYYRVLLFSFILSLFSYFSIAPGLELEPVDSMVVWSPILLSVFIESKVTFFKQCKTFPNLLKQQINGKKIHLVPRRDLNPWLLNYQSPLLPLDQ